MMSEYSQKGPAKAKEDCEATTQQPTREKPGNTIPKNDPVDKRPKGNYDALGMLDIQRNYGELGESKDSQDLLGVLLVLMFLVPLAFGIFTSFQNIARTENAPSYELLALATYAGLFLLSIVVAWVVKQQKSDTAFIIFWVLLIIALFLTPVAYFVGQDQRMPDTAINSMLINPSWVMRQAFCASAPGLWLLVFGSGFGLWISMQENPD